MVPTLSIIVATGGRPTVARTHDSLWPQLRDGDEIIIRRDRSFKGNSTRDHVMPRCAGSHLWWMDDDDVATEDALEIIRTEVAQDPGTVHIFRMVGKDLYGGQLWDQPRIEFGRIGGTMCVVPNIPGKLGTWVHDRDYGGGKGAGGDFHFLTETLSLLGRGAIFHEQVIAEIRP